MVQMVGAVAHHLSAIDTLYKHPLPTLSQVKGHCIKAQLFNCDHPAKRMGGLLGSQCRLHALTEDSLPIGHSSFAQLIGLR